MKAESTRGQIDLSVEILCGYNTTLPAHFAPHGKICPVKDSPERTIDPGNIIVNLIIQTVIEILGKGGILALLLLYTSAGQTPRPVPTTQTSNLNLREIHMISIIKLTLIIVLVFALAGIVYSQNFTTGSPVTVRGRVFNEAESKAGSGLGGVKVILLPVDARESARVLERTTAPNGTYEFTGLQAGEYTVEIDPLSVPANFRVPEFAGLPLNVKISGNSYHEIPLDAQRVITGTVFIDENRDGRYSAGIDKPVQGAYVTINGNAVISDAKGAYVFRNLSAGRVEVLVMSARGTECDPIVIELETLPVIRRAVNIPVKP